jgi:hypothetical protein
MDSTKSAAHSVGNGRDYKEGWPAAHSVDNGKDYKEGRQLLEFSFVLLALLYFTVICHNFVLFMKALLLVNKHIFRYKARHYINEKF